MRARRSLLRLARRNVAARWRQLGSTLACIAVATAFFAGIFVLITGAERAYQGLTPNPATDVVIDGSEPASQPVAPTGEDEAGPARVVDAGLVEVIAAMPGVQAAVPEIVADVAVSTGDRLVEGTSYSSGAIELRTWRGAGPLNRWSLVEGSPPSGSSVVVDQRIAQRYQVGIGSRLTVATPVASETLTVGGIARFGDRPNAVASNLFTDLATAQRLTGHDGTIDAIVVDLADGPAGQVAAGAIGERAVAAGLAVRSGGAVRADDDRAATAIVVQLGSLFGFFGVLALFVAVFVIAGTVSTLVLQRSKELALLRSIGATPRQVRRLVRWEAMALGVLGSLLGVVGGFGFAAAFKGLLTTLGVDLESSVFAVGPLVAIAPVVIGVGVCRLAAWRPARRAGRISPMALLQASATDAGGMGRLRGAAGFVCLAGAAALVAAGRARGGLRGVQLAGLSMPLTFIGFALLGPLVVRVLLAVMAPLVDRAGPVARFARRSLAANPRRAASSASAVMLGVGLIAASLVLVRSLEAALYAQTDRTITADAVVQPSLSWVGSVPQPVVDGLAAPEVTVVRSRYSRIGIQGSDDVGLAADAANVDRVADIDLVAGALGGLGDGGIAVTRDLAIDRGWTLGSSVELTGLSEPLTTTVEAILAEPVLDTSYLLDYGWEVDRTEAGIDQAFFAGVDPTALRTSLGSDPTLEVVSGREFAERYSQAQGVGFVYAMLGFLVAVAVIGVAGAQTLSVVSRTRELGAARAIGLQQRQLRRLIALEGLLVGALGVAVGVTAGVAGAAGALWAANRPEALSVSVPWLQVALLCGAATGACVLAALLPARRAGRIPPLAAMATG